MMRPGTRARLAVAAAVMTLLAALLVPCAAFAMSDTSIVLSKETGGQLTRFTFAAQQTDKDAPIDSLTLQFPKGFDLSKTYNKIQTLQGLDRTPVTTTQTVNGSSIEFAFTPGVEPSSTLNVYVYDVMTPEQGGSFPLGVTYRANGQTRSAAGLSFSYATPSYSEKLSRTSGPSRVGQGLERREVPLPVPRSACHRAGGAASVRRLADVSGPHRRGVPDRDRGRPAAGLHEDVEDRLP